MQIFEYIVFELYAHNLTYDFAFDVKKLSRSIIDDASNFMIILTNSIK